MSSFGDFLETTAAEVATWPAWKQNLLGEITMTDQCRYCGRDESHGGLSKSTMSPLFTHVPECIDSHQCRAFLAERVASLQAIKDALVYAHSQRGKLLERWQKLIRQYYHTSEVNLLVRETEEEIRK